MKASDKDGREQGDRPIRVGVSACLLGQKVRYDGGHKHDRYLTDLLGAHCEFVPVCPELEVGMGVPREAVRLLGSVEAPRMVGRRTGEDWTARMNRCVARRVAQLETMELSGYILKKDSPSCGMERVKVYGEGEGALPDKTGRGLFARALMERLPLLPVEEEGRLNDARLRENFIVRVFSYHRLQDLFRGRWKRGRVVSFHAAHKLLLMAHSPAHYAELGRLVARVKDLPPAEFRARYSAAFMAGLQVRATASKHANVLQHVVGYLRDHVDPAERDDILSVIEDHRRGIVPLIVPMTLVRHYVRKHAIAYIADQTYLNPHPKELMLRNHV